MKDEIKTVPVVLTTSRAGTGFVQSAGETVEVPADEAERLIKAGQAKRPAK